MAGGVSYCLQLRVAHVVRSLLDVTGRTQPLHVQLSCPAAFSGTTMLVWLLLMDSTLLSRIKPKHRREIRDCTQEVPQRQEFNIVFFCLHQFVVHLMTPLVTKLVKNLLSKLNVCLRFFAAIELASAAISGAHNVRMNRTMNPLGCGP